MKRLLSTLLAVLTGVGLMIAAGGGSQLKPQQQMNGKFGYVSPTGTLVIKARYDDARPFREGMAAVEIAGKWGYIDEQGRQVVKCQYGYAADFNEGYGIVTDRRTRLYGAVNTDGDLIVACEYEREEDLMHAITVVTGR